MHPKRYLLVPLAKPAVLGIALLSATVSLGHPALPSQAADAKSNAEGQRPARQERLTPYEQEHSLKSKLKAATVPIDVTQPLISNASLNTIKNNGLPNSLCINGGFETGNLSMWYLWTGSFKPNTTGLNFAANPTTGALTSHSSTFGGTQGFIQLLGPTTSYFAGGGVLDNIVNPNSPPIQIPFAVPGNYRSLRLGNCDTSPGVINANSHTEWNNGFNFGAEAAGYKFRVTPANAKFKFRYAVVQEDPNHMDFEQPRFICQLINLSAPSFPVINSAPADQCVRVASATDPFYKNPATGLLNSKQYSLGQGNTTVLWRQVSCYGMDLTSYIGKDVLVLFVNTDCGQGGHNGYTYIDSLCDTSAGSVAAGPVKTKVCEGDPLIIDASPTVGEIGYTWTMVRLNSLGQTVSGSAASQTFPGSITGPMDLLAWYGAQGKPVICGQRYRITLDINTECALGEDSKTWFVTVDCCPIDCCKDGPVKPLGMDDTKLVETSIPGRYEFYGGFAFSGSARRVELTLANVVQGKSPPGLMTRSYGFLTAFQGLSASSGSSLPMIPTGVSHSRIARWEGLVPVNIGVAQTPVYVHVAPQTGPGQHFLKLTFRYASYNGDCVVCEGLQSYHYRIVGGKPTPISANQWPNFTEAGGPYPIVESQLDEGQARSTGAVAKAIITQKLWPNSTLPCCLKGPGSSLPADLRMTNNPGAWGFTPVLTFPGVISRMEVTMVNASGSYSNGVVFPIYGYVQPAGLPLGFQQQGSLASPYPHVAYWSSPGAVVSQLGFPMQLSFPIPPINKPLFVFFTMKYAATNPDCQVCDHYGYYYFRLERGKEPVAINPDQWGVPVPNKLLAGLEGLFAR